MNAAPASRSPGGPRSQPQQHGDRRPDGTVNIILESISDGVFTVDMDWRITSFNRAAEEITEIPRKEALGRFCSEVFRSSMCETNCSLRRTMESGKAIINKPAVVVNAEGKSVPVSISTALLRDYWGKVIGGVETFRDLTLVEELRKELEGHTGFGNLISHSRALQRIFKVLPEVASSDSTVLIQGQTGTGKELLARVLHDLSPRREKPFVAVNCGALPDTLLESELFGYKAGAFTDARRDKPGRFALAEGGTLFLDEIGDVSPALQVRLLRVLQERVYEPLGATKSSQVDVRVISASNRDLTALVKEGRLRSDFFYRVNVIKLEMPPLRERREDIPLLVDQFVVRFNRLRNRSLEGVSTEAMALLMSCEYPGNIRQLENAIEHAFVLCRGNLIQPDHLPEYYRENAIQLPGPGAAATATAKGVEAQLLMAALRQNDFNRLATARELGIHKSTLFRKIKALGLKPPKGNQRRKRREETK
jgi:PAS domain S-box-containing protein